MNTASGPQSSPGGMGRRRFLANTALRGMGVSIGLPVLESLWHQRSGTAATICPAGPTRMAFVYVPNGVNLEHWRSEGDGRDYTLGQTLEPLAPFKSDFQIVSGLAHRNGFAGPDGAGAHPPAPGGYHHGYHLRHALYAWVSHHTSTPPDSHAQPRRRPYRRTANKPPTQANTLLSIYIFVRLWSTPAPVRSPVRVAVPRASGRKRSTVVLPGEYQEVC